MTEWRAEGGGFELAVCAEMVCTDLPLLERVERIHHAGFSVEIWGWTDKSAAARTLTRVAALGERHGVRFVLENLDTEVDHPGTPFARAADTLALAATGYDGVVAMEAFASGDSSLARQRFRDAFTIRAKEPA